MNATKTTLLLEADDIKLKLRRIASEILEQNYRAQHVVLAGINQRGALIARKLRDILKKASAPFEVELIKVDVLASAPSERPVVLDKSTTDMNGKVVIIVDDVANTGRTLLYAMKPFLDFLPDKIQVAVLVDRKHKLFPVCSDYVGLTLSTTLQEHIEVEVAGDKITRVRLTDSQAAG